MYTAVNADKWQKINENVMFSQIVYKEDTSCLYKFAGHKTSSFLYRVIDSETSD